MQNLNATRLLVATPEALSGLLSSDQQFLRRISLVICDEGHLLGAQGSRGIGLELLLARLKGRDNGPPRFIFISAIVPNVEEINAWLGGTADSIIRSDYRPALAEFGVLRERRGDRGVVNLEVHPHLPEAIRFTVANFLSRTDFRHLNPASGRNKTLQFTSIKRRAVAAARKALSMGTAVVFAANKRGDQGAVGIAEELLEQLSYPLGLPAPSAFTNGERRLGWIRETGARMRMIETVETDLLNQFTAWETLDNPTDEQFLNVILQWAWDHGYLTDDIRKAYRLAVAGVRDSFFVIVRRWLMGDSFSEMAVASATAVDDTLAIYTGAISYGLQTIIEQGISLLAKLLESQGRLLAESVRLFPEHLRFGAPTAGACVLSKSGIRHRRAAVLLGETQEVSLAVAAPRAILFNTVRQLLEADEVGWRDRLGTLIYENTISDLA